MKLLNLSNLTVSTNRRLQIGDKVHEIKPLKVSDFIRVTEQAEQIAKEMQEGDFSIIKEVRLIIDFVLLVVPSVTREELESLALEDLHRINNFIRGMDDIEGVVESTEIVESNGEGK